MVVFFYQKNNKKGYRNVTFLNKITYNYHINQLNIVIMNPENLRSTMIDTIVEYSSDELETSDYIIMAKESESELLDRVISILEYYKREADDLSALVK